MSRPRGKTGQAEAPAPRDASQGERREARENAQSVEVVARLLNISPRRVQQLAKEGVLPTEGRGRYRTVECVHAYIRYWQERAESGGTSRINGVTHADARLRKEIALAELREMEVATMRGENITLDVHEERVQALAERMAAACRNLQHWAGDVRLAETEAEALALLERIADGILASLLAHADALEREAMEEDDGDDPGG